MEVTPWRFESSHPHNSKALFYRAFLLPAASRPRRALLYVMLPLATTYKFAYIAEVRGGLGVGTMSVRQIDGRHWAEVFEAGFLNRLPWWAV